MISSVVFLQPLIHHNKASARCVMKCLDVDRACRCTWIQCLEGHGLECASGQPNLGYWCWSKVTGSASALLPRGQSGAQARFLRPERECINPVNQQAVGVIADGSGQIRPARKIQGLHLLVRHPSLSSVALTALIGPSDNCWGLQKKGQSFHPQMARPATKHE